MLPISINTENTEIKSNELNYFLFTFIKVLKLAKFVFIDRRRWWNAVTIRYSKLDYCNSLILNLDSTQIQRLQLIQNSLARAVTRTPRHHHITLVLKSLHW